FTSDQGKSFLERALERARALIDSVKGAFASMGKWLVGMFEGVLSDIDGIFGNYFRAIVALLKGDFSGFAEHMRSSIMAVFDYLLRHVGNVLGMLDKGAKLIGLDTNLKGLTANVAGRPSTPTQSDLSDIDGIFGNYFRAIVALLKGDFSGFAEHMRSSIMAVFDYLLRHVGNVLGMLDKGAKLIGLDTNLKGLTANVAGRPSTPTQ